VPASSLVAPRGRFARSVNVERDGGGIGGYLPTGRALDVIGRVGRSVTGANPARAFSITGPYGTGKSSLAVFFDAVLGPDGQARVEAVAVLRAVSPDVADLYLDALDSTDRGFIRAVVTASREPVAATVTRALALGARRYRPARDKAGFNILARSLADAVKAAVAGLPPGLAGHRDRLLLTLGFAGGFRRSELAGITVADVEQVAEGLLVHLERSKTDQEGKGRRVEIVYGTDAATCPVRAWRTWLAASGIVTGPVFRRVDRHDRLLGPLSPQGVALVVKRHMGRLGHTTGDFAGHSLRRGHATTAARNGASERTIMRTTGHTSTQTVRGYIEDGELFSDPASKYLGL